MRRWGTDDQTADNRTFIRLILIATGLGAAVPGSPACESSLSLHGLPAMSHSLHRIDPPQRLSAPHAAPARPTREEVERLVQLLSHSGVELPAVARLAANSPGLSHAILRAANSVEFGLRQTIVHLPHAVALLGLRRLQYLSRSLLLAEDQSQSATARTG